MLTLYDNPFSPFARKVRMVLRYKGARYDTIDALALDEHLCSDCCGQSREQIYRNWE